MMVLKFFEFMAKFEGTPCTNISKIYQLIYFLQEWQYTALNYF